MYDFKQRNAVAGKERHADVEYQQHQGSPGYLLRSLHLSHKTCCLNSFRVAAAQSATLEAAPPPVSVNKSPTADFYTFNPGPRLQHN